MDTRAIVKAVCTLPDVFRSGSQSAIDLVRSSGVLESPQSLNRADILAFLSEQPGLVHSWRQWSDDKRTSSGWFFQTEAGEFVVGFHPKGERLVFSNGTEACAEFVVREVTDLSAALRSTNVFKGRRAKRVRP
jgi:hypothetical protein